jgi:hypothetical protein
LIVLLDLLISDHPSLEEEDRVELAVSFAATVCHAQLRQSRDSNLFVASAGDSAREWSGKSGAASQESLMKYFAGLAAGSAPPLDRIVDSALKERGIGTRTVIISTRPRANGRLAVLDQLKTAAELGKDVVAFSANAKELEPYFYLPS